MMMYRDRVGYVFHLPCNREGREFADRMFDKYKVVPQFSRLRLGAFGMTDRVSRGRMKLNFRAISVRWHAHQTLRHEL